MRWGEVSALSGEDPPARPEKRDGEHTAEHYLQSYVTDRIGKFLAQHGRRIIGWDEILEGRRLRRGHHVVARQRGRNHRGQAGHDTLS